jgi:phenylpropionate dioxygenase-like ring-hydroxylating dioxygenase large terminal subunit
MFLAHTLSINDGSYIVLEQTERKQVLVNANGYSIVSNICPHQGSLISQNNGKGNRVCPYHSWSFKLDGTPLSSGRTEYYCKNETPLVKVSAFKWNSLLFSTPVDFKISEKFDNLKLIECRTDIVNASYQTIMDLFLDVDHIQSVHSGVYDLVGITDTSVSWDYYSNGSIQTVSQGAQWIAVYPYTMIEWQQGSVFITVAKSFGNQSKVFVFKYMDLKYPDKWEINEKVWETAWAQDKQQAESITGFSQENLEPQKIHFREFLKLYGTH